MSEIYFDIIICCYNSEKYIKHTIDSVIAQTYKNWRIVILNDGSTDNTEKIVQEYIEVGISIIYFYQKNRGFGYARQKAFELCTNDWIAILDHDDIWYSNKLKLQAIAIKQYSSVGLFFSNSEWFTDDGTILRTTLTSEFLPTGIVPNAFSRLLSGCYIDSETIVFNREALISIGGFNVSYTYIADYDVFIKIAKKYDLYYTNEILAKWRTHAQQATQTLKPAIITEHIHLLENILKNNEIELVTRNYLLNRLQQYYFSFATLEYKNHLYKIYIQLIFKSVIVEPFSIRSYYRAVKTVLKNIVMK